MKPSKAANKPILRISGGKYRGKCLQCALIPSTRPTKSIVKDSIFDTLQGAIAGKTFAEIFAGYGSVGFEAYSRGAKSVIFIEKNPAVFGILSANAGAFGVESSARFRLFCEDSLVFLPHIMKRESIDIMYFDPPFGEKYYAAIIEILESIAQNATLRDKIVIFEHDSGFEMPRAVGDLPLYKTRKFGRSAVSYYWEREG